MRNLKKFLALVMAMVMALSLMVSASAATTNVTYKDSDQVDPAFAEALTILSGMGVFKGDGDGSVRPGSGIIRGEVAALIYRLATGDVTDARAGLYTVYNPFTDVAESEWFAGYVGYCYNAGYIKGTTATTYNPYDEVTGYEVLAMLLRAIGYDKNHEFEGSQWIVRVSSLATELGILKDVKTTHYGDTLYLASRRDVVASMMFRAANDVPTVNYTPIAGYNKYDSLVGTRLNPTLGWMNFGLTDDEGIVVGNQDTGEANTRLSISALNTQDPVYSYVELDNTWKAAINPTNRDNVVTESGGDHINWIVTFNWDTGLEQFAHNMNVWFDGRSTFHQTSGVLEHNNVKTYAMFDRSTNSAVVKLTEESDKEYDDNALKVNVAPDATDGTDANNLYSLAKDNGFKVGTTTNAYMNQGFERFLPDEDTSNDTLLREDEYGSGDTAELVAPENLYLLISNSADKALDVVIGLNLQTTEVTGVDNVNTIKTVSVPYVEDTDAANLLTDNGGWDFIDDDNQLGLTQQGGDIKTGTLEQKQLVRDSSKTLGQYAIGVRIEGTATLGGTPKITSQQTSGSLQDQGAPANITAVGNPGYEYERYDADGIGTGTDYDIGWFYLKPVTNYVDVTVAYFNDKGVTTTDGKFYEYSMIYHTVVPGTIDQPDEYDKATYRLWLTDAGKVLGAEHTFGSKFLYGTYVDYTTPVNSSTFTYTMTYVDLDGKTDVATISKLTRTKNGSAVGTNATYNVQGTNQLGVPFRNAMGSSTSSNFIDLGQYRGFMLDDTTANWNFKTLANNGIIAGANENPNRRDVAGYDTDEELAPLDDDTSPYVVFNGDPTDPGDHTNVITIDSDAVTLGAAYAGEIDLTGSAVNKNGVVDEELLYFTGNTKFILVSGYGTDSVKAEVFNGIKELKGDSSKVYIDLSREVNNGTGFDADEQVRLANILDETVLAEMTYLKQSPFVYAQNRVLSRQADVIILPAAAVSRTTSSNTYYVGNATPIQINAYGEEATQFAMYQKGERKNIWVQGLTDNTVGSHVLTVGGNKPASDDLSADAIIDTGHDHFYKLVATTKKANDGETIYKIDSLTNLDYTQNKYVASTYSAQTGSFTIGFAGENRAVGTDETLMKNVGTAPIVNLNKDRTGANLVWPGITDLVTLNYAGSLGNYNPGGDDQYGGNTPLYVSAIADGLTITELYVCYEQVDPTEWP